ncbi:hypothetical protein L211DRAFT_852925 [Terfezia boudieri ATCC MYA-4762]|uniref:Uncharacterized protein n=1 Tax=Terfezia boudieri ATCC MYA-4762 TaxID=1051890 RepID=A0A3N4LP34_9PEZI|nr:hypothetical protein L211DRAFT_852925 [Terfezia boudieri ATCC MYA-4762]
MPFQVEAGIRRYYQEVSRTRIALRLRHPRHWARRRRRQAVFARDTHGDQQERSSLDNDNPLPQPSFSSYHLRRFIQAWHRRRQQEQLAAHFICYWSGLPGQSSALPPVYTNMPSKVSLWRESREARLEEVLRFERYTDTFAARIYHPRLFSTAGLYMESDDDSDD